MNVECSLILPYRDQVLGSKIEGSRSSVQDPGSGVDGLGSRLHARGAVV